jgi:hypothetical protein
MRRGESLFFRRRHGLEGFPARLETMMKRTSPREHYLWFKGDSCVPAAARQVAAFLLPFIRAHFVGR